jgi:bacteriophage N4 adsorption protein B
LDSFWSFLFAAREELLLFSGFWFLIGGLDDLVIDLIWIVRASWRKVKRYHTTRPMRADQLPMPGQSGPLAIFIPAWHEAAVIGKMIDRCQIAWAHGDVAHDIYVGCYPNDSKTISAVGKAAAVNTAIRLVLCDQPGPTTKADCLNRLWRAMTQDELSSGTKYKAIILHDAEDAVHALELRVVDYLIEKAAAVQLPVIPIQVPGSAWISGHYGDEFAEAHGKTLVVREALGAAVPLAGVGCAIERNRLGRIAISRGGRPFDATSLTEDYELGLALGAEGGKTIFARLHDADGTLVGTSACFPDSFKAATRQKARWMTGISLAGWDRLGWRGGWAETWMRVRDRKAVLAAIVLVAAYACIILSAGLFIAGWAGLAEGPTTSPTARTLLLATLALLIWRIVMRAYFVWLMHGTRQAMLSIPRGFIANLVAIAAARRACWTYLRHIFGRELTWDKTTHAHFPDEVSRHG